MKLSTFNLYVPAYPDPESVLVHNTSSGAFVILGNEQLEVLRRADRGEAIDAEELEVADDPELHHTDVGVLVESRAAEEAEYRDWFERRRTRAAALDVIVGINLACNFACTYCTEGDVLDGSVMHDDVIDATAHWLADRAATVGLKAIALTLIGGEPLLHPDRCKKLIHKVRAYAAPGTEVTFRLTTNGYFLSPELVDEFADLGLTGAQVTLDGDETTHAHTRISKKGEDTFERIFANVIAASRRIKITIRGNYQMDTLKGFGPLVRKLAEAGLPSGSRVAMAPALAGLGAPAETAGGSCTWSGTDMRYQVALHDEVLKAGFAATPLHVMGPCEFHDHHAFAIDPAGNVYKCPGFLGHPEWAIGTVRSGLTRRYEQMLRVNPQRECGSCAHRPNCSGGCIATEWISSGRMEGIACERSYFDSVVPDAMPRQFLLATRDETSQAVAEFPPPPAELPPPSPSNPPRSVSRGRRPAALRVLAA